MVFTETPQCLNVSLGFKCLQNIKTIASFEIVQRGIVQEIDINRLHAQPLQTALGTAANIVRGEMPLARDHIVAAFGTQNDLVAIRALFEERADQGLAVSGAIGVRGVNKIHPGVYRRVQRLGAHSVIDWAKGPADG